MALRRLKLDVGRESGLFRLLALRDVGPGADELQRMSRVVIDHLEGVLGLALHLEKQERLDGGHLGHVRTS